MIANKTYYEDGVWDCHEDSEDGSLIFTDNFGKRITGVVETEDGNFEVEDGYIV